MRLRGIRYLGLGILVILIMYRVTDGFNRNDQMRIPEILEGVQLITEEANYAEKTTELNCTWFNYLEDEIMYGNHFKLEKLINNHWESVRRDNEPILFVDIGYILEPNSFHKKQYKLSCYTEGLEPGEYRLAASYTRQALNGVDYGSGNYPEYEVHAYFQVN